MLQEMNKNMHLQMKNPYLATFFRLLQGEPLQSSKGLNYFDYLAILLRFLPQDQLSQKLHQIVLEGIQHGDLLILPIIGLNSNLVFPLL